MTTNLNTAETRLAELYADQARAEEETVARLELVDRLRAQIQEIEREKREVLRRYNEQVIYFFIFTVDGPVLTPQFLDCHV